MTTDAQKTKAELIKELEILRQSEEQYRQLFESANDLIVTFTLAGIITTVNRRAEGLLGWSREEIIGRHYSDFLTPASVQLTEERTRRIQAGENVPSISEIELVHKNGSKVSVEARTRFLRDREGKVNGFLGIYRDLSARQRQTEELRKSKEQLTLIFNGVSDLIFLIGVEPGPHFRYLAVNPSLLKITGFPQEKIVNRTVEEVFPPAEAAAVAENYEAAVRAELPITYEEQRNLPSGRLMFETTLTPVFDEQGKCTHLLGTSHDITARKRAEEALQESESRYRNLFENANDAIVTFTLEGTVTHVNRGLEVLLGWSREKVIAQHYRKFVAPASVALGEERTRRFLAGEHLPSIFEAEMVRKDGSVVPVEVRTRPIRDADGKPIGMQGIYRDITARKQTEEALRRSEQFKTLLITQCPLAVVTYAPNGDVTMVNKAFMEMWGVSWEQVKGYNLFADLQLLSPPSLSVLQRLMEGREVSHEVELQYDMKHLVPGKGKKWISAKYYAVRDDNDNVVSLVCFAEDISNRKQAEDALRERELRLRTLLASVPVTLWAVDRRGVFTFVQGRDIDPLENAYESLVGRSVFEVYRGAPQLLENMRRALAGEELLRTIEVGERTFEIHHTLLRDQQGAVDSVIGVSIDVTERNRMEEALRASEERYRDLFENANDAIAIMNLDRTVVNINRAMERLLGWSRDELIGHGDRKILTPAGIALAEERERRLQAGEKIPSTFEHEFVRKDGSTVLVEGRTRFIRDKVGTPVGFQGVYRDITERKQAEEALRQAEQQYRMLVDSTHDGVFVIQEAKVRFCNEAFAGMVGYTREEVVGGDFRTLIAPEDLEMVADRYRRRQGGEQVPWSYEFRMLHKDQRTRVTVEMNVTLISYQGTIASMGTVRDITARKRAEEALQKSEQRYRAVSELISDYAYAVKIEPDGAFSVDWFTETFTRVTGFTLEKGPHAPGTWQVFIHPADLPIVLERIRKLRSGQADVSEFRIITKNQESRWVQEHGRPIWDETHGRVTHIYIAGRDITERKLMEESLRNSEQRYRGLVESQQDLIVRTDPHGRFTFVNDAYCKKFTKQREELLGASFVPLVHEDDQPAVLEVMKRLEVSPYRVSVEQRALTAEGWRWIAWEDYAIRDEQGRILEIQAVGRDITDRKQAEAEQQKLQEQLFQARKLEALGTLAGGVAHDFNNILSAIMGFTELATDDVAQGTETHSNLQEVLKASRRAKTLVQQILTFSQPLSQQKTEPIQLHTVIEEVLTFLRASLPRTINLRHHLDEAAGSVSISPSQVQQVLSNLCHNAVQALSEQGGVLEVSLRQVEVGREASHLHNNLQPGPHLQLMVRDTGCGMSPEIQGRIFEPFFTTRRVGEGNGLGLAIVHGIVTGRGGAVTVDSEVGKGTTFQVYLPVTAGSQRVAATARTATSESLVPIEEKGEVDHDTHLGH
jgi:PAS domain S-box-containing protein